VRVLGKVTGREGRSVISFRGGGLGGVEKGGVGSRGGGGEGGKSAADPDLSRRTLYREEGNPPTSAALERGGKVF